MSRPTVPDLRPCPACSLRFPSSALLRRHEALDHRAAPDGAWLTAQCLTVPGDTAGTAPTDLTPAGEQALPSPPTHAAARTGAADDPRLPVALLVLAVLTGLTAVLGLVPALAVAVLGWAHWARWRRRVPAAQPPHRPDDRHLPAT